MSQHLLSGEATSLPPDSKASAGSLDAWLTSWWSGCCACAASQGIEQEIITHPGIDNSRLMIYSSDTPDIKDFRTMLKCQSFMYDFSTADISDFEGELLSALKRNGGEPFQSIALACHGPIGQASERSFEWKISEKLQIHAAADVRDAKNEAVQLLQALANNVKKDSGRVDLLACALLATPEGNEFLNLLEGETKSNFAASSDLTGNLKDGGDWIMESDGVDISPLYFSNVSAFDGTFAGHNARNTSPGGGNPYYTGDNPRR